MFYKKNLGFSLIEALVILTIFIIITSISMPYFNNFFASKEANNTIRVLNSFLKSAKNEAAIRHTNIVICASTNNFQCENNDWSNNILLFIDLNANRQIDTDDIIIHSEQLNLKYGKLTWQGALNSPYIVFNKELGLPIGYNGSFYYCNSTTPIFHKIILSKMGHIRTEKLQSC
jgi:type IV fimbrial biogenesis protein FimT